MSNVNSTSENKVFMCSSCGTHFITEIIGDCLCCGNGIVKSYGANGALLINALERACYEVSEFTISSEFDRNRKLRIVFVSPICSEPPKGFDFERGSKTMSSQGEEYWTKTAIYKYYRADTPTWKYALELTQNMARLTEWVFSLPNVKSLMGIPEL